MASGADRPAAQHQVGVEATLAQVRLHRLDVDALTLQRTIENAVGDTALVFDMLTGENGEEH